MVVFIQDLARPPHGFLVTPTKHLTKHFVMNVPCFPELSASWGLGVGGAAILLRLQSNLWCSSSPEFLWQNDCIGKKNHIKISLASLGTPMAYGFELTPVTWQRFSWTNSSEWLCYCCEKILFREERPTRFRLWTPLTDSLISKQNMTWLHCDESEYLHCTRTFPFATVM